MKIGVTGYTGRVGQLIIQELQSGAWSGSGLELAGGLSRTEQDETFFITTSAEELFERSDAVIDFSQPEGTREYAKIAAETGTTLIIGTTGLSDKDEAALATAADKTTIIYAANMSVGVNLLLALVEKAAKALDPEHWDIEIFESHHKHKVDAPSGTALAIGKAAAQNRTLNTNPDRNDKRETGTIGFSVARGGDVVGEHTAFFYGEGERIELTHIATNRALFARGALKASLWSKAQPPGLYSMQDVLGL